MHFYPVHPAAIPSDEVSPRREPPKIIFSSDVPLLRIAASFADEIRATLPIGPKFVDLEFAQSKLLDILQFLYRNHEQAALPEAIVDPGDICRLLNMFLPEKQKHHIPEEAWEMVPQTWAVIFEAISWKPDELAKCLNNSPPIPILASDPPKQDNEGFLDEPHSLKDIAAMAQNGDLTLAWKGICYTLSSTSFFKTVGGLIGWCPPQVEKGDRLCRLATDDEALYIVRPSGDRYRLVSACTVVNRRSLKLGMSETIDIY